MVKDSMRSFIDNNYRVAGELRLPASGLTIGDIDNHVLTIINRQGTGHNR
jgi:hypothetical protein